MTCPLCGAPMTKRFNGFGPFWICVLWDVRGWGCMGIGELTMKSEIKLILRDFAHRGGIDTAAQAIVDLVERQPVDRVQAMAMLIRPGALGNSFLVPDSPGYYRVLRQSRNHFSCRRLRNRDWCGDDCDHIQAVKLYLAQKEQAACEGA